MKLSRGDTVVITTGKDKGKKGQILRVLHAENRVVVAGVNLVTKHVKKTAQSPGSTVKFERSIHASNVAILDPKSGKPSRIGYTMIDGKKVRVAKKSGTPLERAKSVPAETKAEKKGSALPQPEATPAPKKASFWSRGKTGAASDSGDTSKVEAGPAQSSTGHTRSAGRGS